MTLIFVFGFAMITALIAIAGDYVLHVTANGNQRIQSMLLVVGAALYAVCALFWFVALHHVTLSQAGVAYSIFTLLALCAIGMLYLRNHLKFRETAIIGLALLVLALAMRFA